MKWQVVWGCTTPQQLIFVSIYKYLVYIHGSFPLQSQLGCFFCGHCIHFCCQPRGHVSCRRCASFHSNAHAKMCFFTAETSASSWKSPKWFWKKNNICWVKLSISIISSNPYVYPPPHKQATIFTQPINQQKVDPRPPNQARLGSALPTFRIPFGVHRDPPKESYTGKMKSFLAGRIMDSYGR